MNTFGNIFRLTEFGESHGPAVGGVIDGCPAGLVVDMPAVQEALNRRRPGRSALDTTRKETDQVQFLSGLFEGRTTGTPMGFVIQNTNQHSADYEQLRSLYRPSHADYTYDAKYGFRDYRGGGRSSARTTACKVVGGAVALQLMWQLGYPVAIQAQMQSVGAVRGSLEEMQAEIARVKAAGDTVGGIIACRVQGVPAGWGEPLYDKLSARLAAAMLSINAAKGFEYGDGFAAAAHTGSEMNDCFYNEQGHISTRTNHSGGIQGGISNGQEIYFRVAFKPIATLMRAQATVSQAGEDAVLQPRGRHDACVLPRALVVVEAMTAMVLADACLQNRSARM